jgi:plastocyanin
MRSQLAAAALVLAAAANAGAQPVDWAHAQPVNVEMIDNKFVPDHLTFQHGTPYRLHLENRGKNLHEFTAPEFLATVTVRDPGALANGGKDIVVQPRGTTDIYLEPRKAGTYPLACADHDWDGMVGEIVVK